jgi:multisubunit Na+/H+ antiporter MnhB subunit
MNHRLLRPLAALLALAVGAVLLGALFSLGTPGIRLPALVQSRLAASGVGHPVTAVLLNFRGYDTLLEIAVLLLAVLGSLALRPAVPAPAVPTRPEAGPVLEGLMRLVLPLAVLAAGYLLWAGSHRPGGAFQAGAVLGGGGVLLRLAGFIPPLRPPGPAWRAGLLLGFGVFLALAAWPIPEGKALLEYRGRAAGLAILLLESVLTLSIGLILVTLFLAAAPPGPEEPP